jgi:cytochrome c
MKVLPLIGIACLAVASVPVLAADANHGKELFAATCAKCHLTTGESDPQMVGPYIKGIVGSKAAAREDFRYSGAMRKSGITWTDQDLKDYIGNPQGKVPGNRMALTKTFEPAEIDDIVAYLKTLQ